MNVAPNHVPVAAPDGELATLLAMFRSTAADLAANRLGRLGPDQARRLRRSARWTLGGALFGVAVLVTIMLTVAARPFTAAQVIVAGILGGALLALGVVGSTRLDRASRAGIVHRETGRARISNRGRAGTFLVVGAREFRVARRAYRLRDDVAYHVYHTPAASAVVSIEPALQ